MPGTGGGLHLDFKTPVKHSLLTTFVIRVQSFSFMLPLAVPTLLRFPPAKLAVWLQMTMYVQTEIFVHIGWIIHLYRRLSSRRKPAQTLVIH